MKKHLLLLSGVLLALSAQAAVITPEQALQRANAQSPWLLRSRAAADMEFVHTFKANEQPVGYVFAAPNAGFMILAANDVASAVLGYSDCEAFSSDNVPDGLQYWLDTYARQIEWAEANGVKRATISRAATREAIAPKITTKWDQAAPYNDLCPVINGKATMTGCVATAMAQVFNYYKYPQKGAGTNKYTSESADGQTAAVQFDFANTTFDWANMIDVYDSNATEAQKKAVATLMAACGASVNMVYTTSESGAISNYVPQAAIKYFKYANSAFNMDRDYYGINEWEQIVYDQLSTYGPLMYSGQSNDGGHAFVCDGYSQDGYFHFNWGWSGISDGYYLLNALDPMTQGIGGSTSGFNFQQSIMANLVPSEGGQKLQELALVGPFQIDPEQVANKGNVSWGYYLYNPSSWSVTGSVALAFEPVGGGETLYSVSKSFSNLPCMDASGSFSYFEQFTNVSIPQLAADVNYKVHPVWSKDSKNWKSVHTLIYGNPYYTASLSDGVVTFTSAPAGTLKVEDMKITPIYQNSQFDITATITNPDSEEFYAMVAPIIMANINDKDSCVFEGDHVLVDLRGGQSMTFEYIGKYTNAYTGPATLYLENVLTEEAITETGYDVTLNSNAAAIISIGDLQYGDGYSNEQNKNDLCFKAKVTCKNGYYGGQLTMYIFPNIYGETVYAEGSLTSQFIGIEAGESTDAIFKGGFIDGVVDKEYFGCIKYDNKWQDSQLVFKITATPTGIEIVPVDDASVKLYDLKGNLVPADRARKGVYISVPQKGKASKVMMK